jgi:hypothetical protein
MVTEKSPTTVEGAAVYGLTSKERIPTGHGSDSKLELKVLGGIVNQKRCFSLVRITLPWLAPRHGKELFSIPEEGLMCAFLTEQGQVVVLLGLNGTDDVLTVFQSDEQHRIVVAARNDGQPGAPFRVIAAVAPNFEDANQAALLKVQEILRKASGHQCINNGQTDEKSGFNNWFDGLAYCTWNSLGEHLTTGKIIAGLDALAAHDINVSTLIIDDNWQTLTGNMDGLSRFLCGWSDFEATTDGFPNGLKIAVGEIRKKHPQVQDVAVWHALLGYWGGVSPVGRLAEKYKITKARSKAIPPLSRDLHMIHADDAHRMYDDFYAFLSSCGITAVKTNVQFFLDELASTPDHAASIMTFLDAWEQAHVKHFGGRAISCMCMIPQILFKYLQGTPQTLLRNSDDFFPEIPASHPWHIFINAHNALFVQHLNVLPDWDMFQTSHSYSGFHAAARCLSGGPIYITDFPGQHDVELIAQMTAWSLGGQSVILRTSRAGKTLRAFDSYHEGHVLKIGTYAETKGGGTSFLSLFNIAGQEISCLVPATDFAESDRKSIVAGSGAQRYLIRSHQTSDFLALIDVT